MFQLLRSSALEIVVLTFIIALGAILLGYNSGLQSSIASTGQTTVTNESMAFTNMTNVSTAFNPILSLTQICNATKCIPSGRYGTNNIGTDVGTQPGQIWIMTNGTYVAGTYLAIYNYPTASAEFNITGTGVVALNTYSTYFGILVIAIIFVAIIGIVMLVAGSNKSKV